MFGASIAPFYSIWALSTHSPDNALSYSVFYTVLTLTLWWMHQGVEYLTQWYFDTWTGGVEDWTLTSWLVNKLFCYLNHPWIEAQQCYIHFNHSGQLYTESAAWQGLKNSSWLLSKNHWSLPKYQDFSVYILQKIYGCKRGISIRGSLHFTVTLKKGYYWNMKLFVCSQTSQHIHIKSCERVCFIF